MTRTSALRLSATSMLLVILFAMLGATISAAPSDEPMAERVLGERVLRMGTWGADVFELQRRLIRVGFDIRSDGLFGPETRQAVISFQVQQGLVADGIAGPLTLRALEEVLEAETATISHVVQPGESLWSIARRYATTMERIVQLNQLTSSVLRVNQTLLVPAPPTYTVQAGDTLSHIAIRYRTTVSELITLNGLTDPGLLRVGQVLQLPRTSR